MKNTSGANTNKLGEINESLDSFVEEVRSKFIDKARSVVDNADRKTFDLGSGFEKEFRSVLKEMMTAEDWKYLDANRDEVAENIAQFLKPVDMGFGIKHNAKKFFNSEMPKSMQVGFQVGAFLNRVPLFAPLANATTAIGSTLGLALSAVGKTVLIPVNAARSYNKVVADEFHCGSVMYSPVEFLSSLQSLITKEKDILKGVNKAEPVLEKFVSKEFAGRKFCANRTFPTLVPMMLDLREEDYVDRILASNPAKRESMDVSCTQVSGLGIEVRRGRVRLPISTVAAEAAETDPKQTLLKNGPLLAAMVTSICRNKCLEVEQSNSAKVGLVEDTESRAKESELRPKSAESLARSEDLHRGGNGGMNRI